MAYDYGALRELAATAPSELTAEQKNALIRERIGASHLSGGARRSERPEARERELVEGSQNDDPDMHLSATNGGAAYMRRLSGAVIKDMPAYKHDRMLSTATFLWTNNPLAARVIKRGVNYVLGEGVEVVAHHEDEKVQAEIQKVIDGFWNDARNSLPKKLLRWCTSWRAYGELFLRVAVNEFNGKVRLAFVSPESVLKVETEKMDVEQVTVVRVKRDDRDNEGEPLQHIRALPNESDPTAVERLAGDIFFFAANTLPDMVRGRSDLLAIADVLDAYDQFVWNRLERQAMALAFVWSVSLANAGEEDIKKWVAKNGTAPRPGSIQVHNDKVKWEAVSPSLGSGEAAQESDLLINYIATSQGMPGMWFGKDQDPNRANGENLTGPTLKDLTSLQNEFRDLIEQVVRFVLDQAIGKGMLPADLDTGSAFVVQMPDLSVNDMATTATTLGAIVTATIPANEAGLLDKQTIQELIILTLKPTGIDVKLADMRARLEDEKAERDQKAQEMFGLQQQMALAGQKPPPGGPPPGGGKPSAPLGKPGGMGNPATIPKLPRPAAAPTRADGSERRVKTR